MSRVPSCGTPGPTCQVGFEKIALRPPRFVSGDPMLVVGLVERHSFGATQGIPGQWQRFMKHYADIPHKLQPIPLGISGTMDTPKPASTIRTMISVLVVSMSTRGDNP